MKLKISWSPQHCNNVWFHWNNENYNLKPGRSCGQTNLINS